MSHFLLLNPKKNNKLVRNCILCIFRMGAHNVMTVYKQISEGLLG